MAKYSIDISCVAITTDMNKGKMMILSTEQDKVVFPILSVNKTNISNINDSIVSLMQKYLMTSSIELSPQIITLNSPHIPNTKPHHLNIIAGFLVKENIKYFDSYWIEFNYESPSTHTPLILDVIQKLR